LTVILWWCPAAADKKQGGVRGRGGRRLTGRSHNIRVPVRIVDFIVGAEEVVVDDLVSLSVLFVVRERDVLALGVLLLPLRLAVVVIVQERIFGEGTAA
jgi:hypothetical protein